MSEVERAIAQIADIRAQLAASTRFRGYAPEAVGILGAFSFMVTLVQLVWPARFASSDQQLVIAWGLLLAAGCFLIAFEAVVRTLRDNDGMASPMLLSAMRIVLPAAVMTTVIPAVVLAYAPQVSWIVPGIWQMLIGLVAFASYPSMPRTIAWPAAWFLVSGAAGLCLAGLHGCLTPVLAGGPFIIGHFAIAWTLLDGERVGHAH